MAMQFTQELFVKSGDALQFKFEIMGDRALVEPVILACQMAMARATAPEKFKVVTESQVRPEAGKTLVSVENRDGKEFRERG